MALREQTTPWRRNLQYRPRSAKMTGALYYCASSSPSTNPSARPPDLRRVRRTWAVSRASPYLCFINRRSAATKAWTAITSFIAVLMSTANATRRTWSGTTTFLCPASSSPPLPKCRFTRLGNGLACTSRTAAIQQEVKRTPITSCSRLSFR